MRVISLVPSWTETLVAAGVEVVGRTRFCIHPAEKVKSIPVVGGTKDINWEKVNALEFDYLILDKEENPKQIADDAECAVLATHITKCADVPIELSRLADKLQNPNLLSLAKRWEEVIFSLNSSPREALLLHKLNDLEVNRRGLQTWIQKPQSDYENVVYVIWKNPFMAVTQETFIGSMLDLLGFPTLLKRNQTGRQYPEIQIEDFNPEKTLFLFSSEPYPFHKKISDLKELNISSAIVDGELYSWFGLRSLRFLESQMPSGPGNNQI